MSDCLVNIRVLDWHFQLTRSLKIRVLNNGYHRKNNWPDGWFSVYEFKPFR